MSHTPGPWAACARQGDDWDSVVFLPNSPANEICQCFHERGNEDECEANARLIAAAPELLGALYGAKAALQHREMRDDNPILANVIAAISKATGGAL